MDRYIVGIGEALWDMLPDGRKIGGAPANFAYHTSQFGFKSKAVSAIGNDPLGDEIVEIFDEKGLEYMIDRVPFPTGTVQVELDKEGVPQYEIKESVAWDNIPFTAELEELAKNTQVVCFGSLAQRSEVSRNTIRRFLDAMPEGERCYKIYDINLRQQFYTKEGIIDSMERCNILKINDDELEIISEMFNLDDKDIQERCWTLLSRYELNMLILTCGVFGSYLFTHGNVSFIETPKVDVADTVGAGDSFTATFIASILNGNNVKDAHKKAVRVSAYVCTQHGAMPVIPQEYK